LQRIQKMAHLNVQIVEDDFPHVREVDMKLIELADRGDVDLKRLVTLDCFFKLVDEKVAVPL
jgi:uncharacterized protein YacL